ncbi:MAG: hypothetical protein JSU86_13330 [Phycisphaerales bacterium]|nr:MAG: hypothetical protein JSU86_13330 [Phycisphaerales bacterium]
MEVGITEFPDQFRVELKTHLALDNLQLAQLVHPASCLVMERKHLEDGPIVYHLDVAKTACTPDQTAVSNLLRTRAVDTAIHSSVWDVDGRPFPNAATEVLSELMAFGNAEAARDLLRIRDSWEEEIRRDTVSHEQTVVPWPVDWEFFGRLKSRIPRRATLVAWIDLFFTQGYDAAAGYAAHHELI